MSLLSTLKNLFSHHADKLPSVDELKGKLPENLNSVDEIKAKAQDLMQEHGDTLQQVTDKIPGEADDKLVEMLRSKVE